MSPRKAVSFTLLPTLFDTLVPMFLPLSTRFWFTFHVFLISSLLRDVNYL